MGKRNRRSELPMLGVLFIAGGFFAGAAVAQPVIHVGEGSGSPNGAASFSVTLSTGGAAVAATQNDIAFDSSAPVAVRTSAGGNCTITITQACSSDADCPILPDPFAHEACVGSPLHCAVTTGQSCTTSADCPTVHEPCVNQSGPACTVDPTIGKGGFFTFLPHVCSNNATQTCTQDSDCTPGTCTGACTPGTNCTGIRAIILAVDNLNPIPDGSALYSCAVAIASDATVPSDHTLTISNESAGAAVCSNDATKACTVDTDCTSPGTCTQVLISGVTGTNGTIHVVPLAAGFLVCDAAPSTGDNLGQFGNGSVLNSDVVAIFKASLTTPPTAGSARFSAMDAGPADVVPACGGNNAILNSDVVLCFRRSLSTTEPNYRRMIDGSCTSALAQ